MDGITQIRNKSPDLIFLDIELPDGTGFDLLRQLPEINSQIIFITAHEDNDYAIQAFRFGLAGFVEGVNLGVGGDVKQTK